METSFDVPLTSFRVFVTVGRHGNFTRAAAALGITQSGVSRQIAKLEALANTTLFKRKGNSVVLTAEGQQLYDTLKDAIATLELTAQQISQRGRPHDRLVVRTSMPSFAMKIVVPHLGTYGAQYGIQIDLVTSLATPQPQDEYDVLITRNLVVPATESWELVREKLVCVASPALIERQKASSEPSWPMIVCRLRPDIISTWAIAADIPAERMQTAASYDHFFLAVEAAIGGVGFLVTPQMLVTDQINGGILALVDDIVITSGASYTASVNPRSRHIQLAEKFCRWLKGIVREANP